MLEQKTEEDWKAEGDARTLAEAEVIRGDSARHERAKEAGERLAKEARERAEAMERISKGKMLIEYDRSEAPPERK